MMDEFFEYDLSKLDKYFLSNFSNDIFLFFKKIKLFSVFKRYFFWNIFIFFSKKNE
jgi:hypothetical protein